MHKDFFVRRETPNATGGFLALVWRFSFYDDMHGTGPSLELSEINSESRETKRHKVRQSRIFSRTNRRDTHKDPASITPEDVRVEAKTAFLATLTEKLRVLIDPVLPAGARAERVAQDGGDGPPRREHQEGAEGDAQLVGPGHQDQPDRGQHEEQHREGDGDAAGHARGSFLSFESR